MQDAQPYPDEQRRLQSLKATRLLDTPIDERFERITRMVCKLMGVPIAIFNLIDEHRQHYKSVQGLNVTDAALPGAFCPHAFHEKSQMLLVPDASKDNRFADNPFVTGKYLNIGFYAGCAVHTPDGMPVGTLCAIDMKPRDMTPDELANLRDLTAMVENELRLIALANENIDLAEELTRANMLAAVDPLTRLWNRRGIGTLLDKEWAEGIRQHKPVSLVLADIDYFKKINDTHGHDVGDGILRGAAKKLLEVLRAEDAVGRIGGEEFLIILNNCEPEKLLETVERIRRFIVENPIKVDGNEYDITMSFGAISFMPTPDKDHAVAIKRADEALYRAKHDGRNCVKIAESA